MNIEKQREKFISCINQGDIEGLAALYSEDAIRKAPGEQDCIGCQEIKEHYSNWIETFSSPQIGDKMVFAKDNVLVCVWAWKATHSKDYMGVPASNKEIGLVASTILWFDNSGEICREHTYADPYTLLIQLGAIEDNGRPVPEIPTEYELIRSSDTEKDVTNKHHLRRYNELLLNKDLEPWLDYMTDDVEWDDQMVPGLAVGKEHSKSDFVMLAEAFPDAKINMQNMWAVGDYVIHQGIFTATHKGPLKGIPASNKVVNVDNMDIAYFDAYGKISKGWTFGNTLDMGAQMGLGM